MSILILGYLSFFLSHVAYLSLCSLFPGLQPNLFVSSVVQLLFSIFAYRFLSRWKTGLKTKLTLRTAIVFLPALFLILIRFPLLYPSHDDLALNLVAGDYARTLWAGKNFMPADIATYFYPAAQMIYTPFLHMVGIRITVLIQFLFFTLWYVSLAERFKTLIKHGLKQWLIEGFFIAFIWFPPLAATHGSLMTDFAAVVIALEALFQFLSPEKDKTFGAILVVLCALIKQSSFLFIVPLFAYYLWIHRSSIKWRIIGAIVLGASIFFLRAFFETGSPLFGLYNGFFQSSLYPLSNFKDGRWGPANIPQTFIWPLIGQFTARYDESVVSMYTKIIFSFVTALPYLFSLVLFVLKRDIKYLIFFLSFLLWSTLSGYSRYAIPLIGVISIALLIEVRLPRLSFGPAKGLLFLLVIMFFSFSSFKVDLAFRPYPSFRTSQNNRIFINAYREGISYLFKDTPGHIAQSIHKDFDGYEAIVPVYRGPVTYYAYLGSLAGLSVVSGKTGKGEQRITRDPRISNRLKQNATSGDDKKKILVAADRTYEQRVTDLAIYRNFSCSYKKNGAHTPLLQGGYFEGLLLFSCQKKYIAN